jgi:hypothetical protein
MVYRFPGIGDNSQTLVSVVLRKPGILFSPALLPGRWPQTFGEGSGGNLSYQLATFLKGAWSSLQSMSSQLWTDFNIETTIFHYSSWQFLDLPKSHICSLFLYLHTHTHTIKNDQKPSPLSSDSPCTMVSLQSCCKCVDVHFVSDGNALISGLHHSESH